MRTTLLFLLGAVLACLAWPYGGAQDNTAQDATLMSDIQVLTLTAGKQTTARRSYSVPQLKCVGGSAAHRQDLYPVTVQCRNVGTDGTNIQWKCEADLNRQVKFGATTISCEGYRDSSDLYVLKGSCGLEYTLDHTGDHRAKRPSGRDSYQQAWTDNNNVDHSGSWFGSIFTFGVLAFIAWAVFKAFCSGSPVGGNTSYAYPTDNTYTSNNDYNTGFNGHNNYNGYNGHNGYNGYNRQSAGWTPGFWSGLGGGGAMGYMFGRQQRPYYQQQRYPMGVPSNAYHDSTSSSSRDDETRTASAYATTNNR